MFGRAWKRIIAVGIASCVALLSTTALAAPSTPAGGTVAVASLESGVLADINSLRRSHGLAQLRLSPALGAAARQHSESMAAKGYFAHESADGSSFWRRVRGFYTSKKFGFWSVGENLLWSSPDIDADGALQMWMNSPPHRANLLTARWREVGISAVHVVGAQGVYGGNDVTIVTADFGVRH